MSFPQILSDRDYNFNSRLKLLNLVRVSAEILLYRLRLLTKLIVFEVFCILLYDAE